MNKKLVYIVVFLLAVVNLSAQSVGGTTSGSTAYCSGNNSGFVSLVGNVGSILFWQSSTNAGVTWTNELNTTPTQSYLNLTQTTHYRAVVKNGSFPEDTSTISIITIHTPSDGGTISGGGSFCNNSGTGALTVNVIVGNVTNWLSSTDNGQTWNNITNTTTTLNYNNITQTTLYMAVVENVATCPRDSSSTALIQIDPTTISGTLTLSDTVCYFENNDTLQLIGNVGNVLDWEFSVNNGISWQPLNNTTNAFVYTNLTDTTLYRALVKSGVCATETTNIVTISVLPPLPVNAGLDTNIIKFQSITLNGSGSGTASWSPTTWLQNPSAFNTIATPEETTTYILTVTDENNCTNSDTLVINVEQPIPNAISPNGDGVNDFFVVNQIETFPSSKLQIFNRYGSVVFDDSPYKNNFEGKSNGGSDLPDGIYYYLLDFGTGEQPINGFILIKR